MRFAAAQVDLVQAVQTVQRAVTTKSTLPVLAGILLTAQDEQLALVATDHEISIRCSAPARVEMPGSIVLPARYVSDILRKIPSGEVSCEVDEGTARALLLWQRSQFVIYGFAAREFPQLPAPDGARKLEISGRALRDLIRRTNFAVSRDDIRPVLTGALLEISPQRVAVFATDGYRIAYAHADGDFGGQDSMSVILPGRALGELQRLLPDGDERIEALIGGNQVYFRAGGVEFTTRVIDGTYPNCRAVIPRDYRATLQAGTEDFLAACDRASQIAREGVQMVMLKLEEGHIRISSETPEIGSAQEEVQAQTTGEPLEVAFSARYLMEALRTTDSDQFMLEISGPGSPARLRPVGKEDAYHIVLPIRLD
ncbi:MAG: DNA polymerase III subunit beta [Bacillota bacterium]|nr:DNA polymerase III subunit beta [Bacillota bacterium]